MNKRAKQWILLLVEVVICGISLWLGVQGNQWNYRLTLALGTAAGMLGISAAVWAFVTAWRERKDRVYHIFYGLALVAIYVLFCFLMAAWNTYGV